MTGRQPRRGHGRERVVLELGTVEGVDRPQAGVIQQAFHFVDVFGAQIELTGEKIPDVGIEIGLDLEADRPAETPAAQLHLHRLQ